MQLMEGLNGLSGCLANQRQGADSMVRFVGLCIGKRNDGLSNPR
jgi:hypothetical protein